MAKRSQRIAALTDGKSRAIGNVRYYERTGRQDKSECRTGRKLPNFSPTRWPKPISRRACSSSSGRTRPCSSIPARCWSIGRSPTRPMASSIRRAPTPCWSATL
ncbi:hypothetical protein BOSE62_71085 [Bosea sp. 62]|nr:hypothetical protein BOSE7B_60107 [Bosea sp. 7B]CAD5296921.1 hypothetical protein BOSE21B_90558 [Bosea sp. 21B]CAD5297195.1 hypothetical protein BOSE46_80641 [Bosea sp. 46]VXB19341.1 hypothetical protein BOSE125_130165 [Bosea sp. 125]VXC86250.1 hypothetical protein BOSE62_71085 [Bosea sp. 62]